MEPIIDHIQITVKNLDKAVQFYDRLMPLLGFDITRRSAAEIPEHDFRVVEYSHPKLCFAITSPRTGLAHEMVHRRRPGSLHHLAFRADSRVEVDRLYTEIKKPDIQETGATIVEPPKEYPEYVPAGYYAVFFKDPDGIKFEIVHAPS